MEGRAEEARLRRGDETAPASRTVLLVSGELRAARREQRFDGGQLGGRREWRAARAEAALGVGPVLHARPQLQRTDQYVGELRERQRDQEHDHGELVHT
jgi:hypothetical protein